MPQIAHKNLSFCPKSDTDVCDVFLVTTVSISYFYYPNTHTTDLTARFSYVG